jgi:hypothetical protein
MLDFLSEDKEGISGHFVSIVQQTLQMGNIVDDVELSSPYPWNEVLRKWIQVLCYYRT